MVKDGVEKVESKCGWIALACLCLIYSFTGCAHHQ